MEQRIRQFLFKKLHSYIVVLLAVIAVILSFSITIILLLKKDINDTNAQSVGFLGSAIDEQLKSIEDYASMLIYSNAAKNIHSYTIDTIDTYDALDEAYTLVYDIRTYISANSLVEDIYIYYPDTEHIIGKQGIYPSRAYYVSEKINQNFRIDEYENWCENLFGEKEYGFFTYSGLDRTEPAVYFYQSTPHWTGPSRVLVVKVSGDGVCSILERLIGPAGFTFIALVDSSNKPFAFAGIDDNFLTSDGYLWSEKNGYTYTSTELGIWDMHLFAAQKYTVLYRFLMIVSSVLASGIVAALFVGLWVSFRSVKKSRSTMEDIAKKLPGITDGAEDNWLASISAGIDSILLEKKSAIEASEQQHRTISFFFLKDLLSTPVQAERDLDSLSSLYGISFENNLFYLIVIRTPKAESPLIEQLLSSYNNEQYEILWTSFEGFCVFLYNVDAVSPGDVPDVTVFSAHCEQVLGSACQYVSPACTSLTQLLVDWQDARKHLLSDGSVITPQKGDGIALLRLFVDAIERKDFTYAMNVLPDFCAEYLFCPDHNLAICRRFTLLGRLYDISSSRKFYVEIDKLYKNITSTDWEKDVEKLLQYMKHTLDGNTNSSQRICLQVKEIIDVEYDNPQMGLTMLAERVGVNQSYLSRIFKQNYGVGINYYLNAVRIDASKKLLLDRSANLSEVALKVGFLSDVNLIRVFKKFENVTPGAFRNMDL